MRTYYDLTAAMVDWTGGAGTADMWRDARTAALAAYTELAQSHPWTYLAASTVIRTNAPYSEGLVSYTFADRTLALNGGAWPLWAEDSYVLMGNSVYPVSRRMNALHATVDPAFAPEYDFSDWTYTLIRDTYRIPDDLLGFGSISMHESGSTLQIGTPYDSVRTAHTSRPRAYSLVGDAGKVGGMQVRLTPAPDGVYDIIASYRRLPRPLRIWSHTGIATLSESSSVITTAKQLPQSYVGSTISFSSSTSEPTRDGDANPPVLSAQIAEIVGNNVTLDAYSPVSVGSSSYRISDPLDIDGVVMGQALLWLAVYRLSQIRFSKDKPSLQVDARRALEQARAADSRSFAFRAVGDMSRGR